MTPTFTRASHVFWKAAWWLMHTTCILAALFEPPRPAGSFCLPGNAVMHRDTFVAVRVLGNPHNLKQRYLKQRGSHT